MGAISSRHLKLQTIYFTCINQPCWYQSPEHHRHQQDCTDLYDLRICLLTFTKVFAVIQT